MTRIKAALIHLAISATIAVAISAFLLLAWYPPPYFSAAGALHLTVVILVVDLVLGPLLTLIVFKSGKPSLKFDLGVIALMQVGALVYGLSVVVESRPVYLVAAMDRFELVAANEVYLDPPPAPDYRRLPWLAPELVAAMLPADADSRSYLLQQTLAGKPDLHARPAYYQPYATAAARLYANSRSLAALVEQRPGQRAEVLQWLQRHGGIGLTEARYLPLVLRERNMVMVLDPRSQRPLGALDIAPDWSDSAVQHPPATEVAAGPRAKLTPGVTTENDK